MPYFYDSTINAVRSYTTIEESYKRECPFCKFVFIGSWARCPRCDKIVEPLSRGIKDTDNATEDPAAGQSE